MLGKETRLLSQPCCQYPHWSNLALHISLRFPFFILALYRFWVFVIDLNILDSLDGSRVHKITPSVNDSETCHIREHYTQHHAQISPESNDMPFFFFFFQQHYIQVSAMMCSWHQNARCWTAPPHPSVWITWWATSFVATFADIARAAQTTWPGLFVVLC